MISRHDLRFALRSLSKAPGFTVAVITTLALGIGANTAIYSVIRGTLLRPLPNRDGERLVYLRQSAKLSGQDNLLFSAPEINHYRTSATLLRGFGEYSEIHVVLRGTDAPARLGECGDAGHGDGRHAGVLDPRGPRVEPAAALRAE